MRSDAGKRRAWLGRLIVVELIVCYLAVLTFVSHARGPVKYRTATESPLLDVEDFVSFAGAREDAILLVNDMAGQAAGFAAELPLEGLEGIRVAFQVDCPPEYAGGTLVVDLYNAEAGYDSAEQEFSLELEPGVNMVERTIDPGESAPGRAQLRIFTLDLAGYGIHELAVCPVEAIPKLGMGLLAAAAACFACLAGSTALWFMDRKNGDKRG